MVECQSCLALHCQELCPNCGAEYIKPIRKKPTKRVRRKMKITKTTIKNTYRTAARFIKSSINNCELCGSDKILQVHHKDKDATNNSIDNLQKLCLPCHMKQHEGEQVYKIMAKLLDRNG